MITDDPGTPGNNNWEINILPNMEHSRGGTTWEVPDLDVNYGVLDRFQIRYEVPYVVRQDDGTNARGGVGNSGLGVKWRFFESKRKGISVSTYPAIEFNGPPRSVRRDLADEGTRWFLPIEVVKEAHGFNVNSELGYLVERDGDNSWEYGIVAGSDFTRRMEVMVELHGSTPRDYSERNLYFNLGSRIQATNQTTLLVSAGRSIRDPANGPTTIATLGLQFVFLNSKNRERR